MSSVGARAVVLEVVRHRRRGHRRQQILPGSVGDVLARATPAGHLREPRHGSGRSRSPGGRHSRRSARAQDGTVIEGRHGRDAVPRAVRPTAGSSKPLLFGGLPLSPHAFAHLGRDEDAREAAARALETDPAFTISAYIDRGGQSNAKLFIEGLRKAWLPE